MSPIAKTAFVALVLALPAAAFSAPRSQNPQRHTQTGRFASQTTIAQRAPAMACDACTTVVKERRIAGQRATVRTQKTECSGCETMAAGGKCY